MADRIDLFDKVSSVMTQKDSSFMCIDTILRQITPHVSIRQRIGSDSVNAEAYKGCFAEKEDECGCDSVAIKLIPLKKEETMYVGRELSMRAMTQTVWSELAIMKLCTNLVMNKVCPNLPILYRYFICHTCRFANENVVEKMQKHYGRSDKLPCVITLNEYANGGDFKHFLRRNRSTNVWLSAYFQIFAGLYTLQKYFDITHHDLHWGNILVRKIQKGGYWKYVIDDKTYYVPNKGYQFLIWDFGYALCPGKIEDPSLAWHHVNEIPRSKVDYMKIANAPVWQLKYNKNIVNNPQIHGKLWSLLEECYFRNLTIAEVIPKIFQKHYGHEPPADAIIEEYSLNKPLKYLPKEAHWLIRDNRLLSQTISEPYIPDEDGVPDVDAASEAAISGDKGMSTKSSPIVRSRAPPKMPLPDLPTERKLPSFKAPPPPSKGWLNLSS